MARFYAPVDDAIATVGCAIEVLAEPHRMLAGEERKLLDKE